MSDQLSFILTSKLATIERDAYSVGRVLDAVAAIRASANRAGSRKEAIANGHRNDSLAMRVRRFHDVIGLHVHKLCGAALYRSRGVLELEAEGRLFSELIRCEHVIPVGLVAGMIWDRYRHASLEDLGRFLLTRTVVAAVTKEEDATFLRVRRSYGEAGRYIRWVKAHPEFPLDADPFRVGIRPFLRYHGTAIEVVCVADGATVNLADYTFEEHEGRLAGLPLYNGRFLTALRASQLPA